MPGDMKVKTDLEVTDAVCIMSKTFIYMYTMQI
jgi:hypothetical protein